MRTLPKGFRGPGVEPPLAGLSAPNCQTKAQGLPVVTFPVALALGPPFLEDPMTSRSYSEPVFSPVEEAESGQQPWMRKHLS